MKIISILALIVLTSCNSFIKHKDELKPTAHDMVDEEIDEVTEELKPSQEIK